MCICDTCKVEASILKSNEPACCAWYMDNVVIGGVSVDSCTAYNPVDTVKKVISKIDPTMCGFIMKWVDSNQFIARVTNRFGNTGVMICHKDYWMDI